MVDNRFQSTYLYKVRLLLELKYGSITVFQSTYLYKVRHGSGSLFFLKSKFQSTYLYKVRLFILVDVSAVQEFQSTYLYKVRRPMLHGRAFLWGFNPRTYIRYDISLPVSLAVKSSFNPRTYIRYDSGSTYFGIAVTCFNPRTYIRYDVTAAINKAIENVSIHVPI